MAHIDSPMRVYEGRHEDIAAVGRLRFWLLFPVLLPMFVCWFAFDVLTGKFK